MRYWHQGCLYWTEYMPSSILPVDQARYLTVILMFSHPFTPYAQSLRKSWWLTPSNTSITSLLLSPGPLEAQTKPLSARVWFLPKLPTWTRCFNACSSTLSFLLKQSPASLRSCHSSGKFCNGFQIYNDLLWAVVVHDVVPRPLRLHLPTLSSLPILPATMAALLPFEHIEPALALGLFTCFL